ncbi:folate-binding protein YgfZ [Marinobacter nanhaiticus D15-8W]|uniref:Folate-binding protein n=1 Tax=Marinobacter nanhaiticus D15-8W TaxID=626887 RepID=N6WYQ1_9GAMM|nr:folate-binding protein YgfZ [Marinobacter nanhaiticus]ENO16691.1 folate-binding protein [Marinobacter nanhaiticus D15-8W]BES72493.1 folate-binding protein YgfZ [Marinobacter nanhaiticus D15-8W]
MSDTATPTESTSTTGTAHLASANRPKAAIARVESARLYRVGGKDPHKFLHGQLSQSLDDVKPDKSRRAAACNPKGRAYALPLLADYEGDIVLRLPRRIADEVTSQLNKFLMLFRGTDMKPLEQAHLYGFWGEATAEALLPEAMELKLPGDSITLAGGKLIRVQDTAEGVARYEYWQIDDSAPIPEGAEATEADWAASEISAGLAELSPSTMSEYVPQMLNLQHVDGIHFKKGCYTGQEVIARMHYLGQLKKSIFRLSLPSERPVEVGTQIIANDKAVGEVINSVGFDDGHQEILAVVKHAALSTPDWHLEGFDPSLERLPLPYKVPEQEAAGN